VIRVADGKATIVYRKQTAGPVVTNAHTNNQDVMRLPYSIIPALLGDGDTEDYYCRYRLQAPDDEHHLPARPKRRPLV